MSTKYCYNIKNMINKTLPYIKITSNIHNDYEAPVM